MAFFLFCFFLCTKRLATDSFSMIDFARICRGYIKEIKQALKVPVLANGDIRSFEEAQKCLEATGADGVLSAEPLLSNPALFSDPPFYAPPSDGYAPIPMDGTAGVDLLIEYLEICKTYKTPFSYIRGHIWKLVGHWMSDLTHLREEFVKENGSVSMDRLIEWARKMKAEIEEIEKTEGRCRPIPKKSAKQLAREAEAAAKEAAIAEAAREDETLRGAKLLIARERERMMTTMTTARLDSRWQMRINNR